MSYLRSKDREFDSGWRYYQVVTTRIDDCWQTGKPSRYITNTKVNSIFHPSGVGKSSTGLTSWSYGGARSPVSMQLTVYDLIRQVTPRSSVMGLLIRAIHHILPLTRVGGWLYADSPFNWRYLLAYSIHLSQNLAVLRGHRLMKFAINAIALTAKLGLQVLYYDIMIL